MAESDGSRAPKSDERADGLSLKIEGALTVALVMASMVASWMAPVAPWMASMASMVASLDRLRFMIEPKSGEERADGFVSQNL